MKNGDYSNSYNSTSLAFSLDTGDGGIDLDLGGGFFTEEAELNQDLLSKDGDASLLSPGDALVVSVRTKGRVDLDYMVKLTGLSHDSIISSLGKSIYCNPETWNGNPYHGWETADEYLSGNLFNKLEAAKEAKKKYGSMFLRNISALSAILPPELGRDEIYVTLGSPWVPESIIRDFINHILNLSPRGGYKGLCHDELTGSWQLDKKGKYSSNVKNKSTFGTSRMSALNIIEKTLNMSPIVVNKTNSYLKTKKVDRDETAAALEKQALIIREFERWLWKDDKRAKEIRRIYNEKFGSKRPRHFDGSFLTFPGMSDKVELYPYQKDAVARILFSPNTLLAHDVGAGKTYIMIAAAMEMKRMGIARKPMFVVPNSITGQWISIFKDMYPQAKVMRITPGDFSPKKKNKTMEAIRDGEDLDAILIPYSCFDKIKLSNQSQIEALRAEEKRLRQSLENAGKRTKRTNARIESTNKKIKALEELIWDMEKWMEPAFDDLGIDRLFVDEAHNYKNLNLPSNITGVLGISKTGSAKCNNMMEKVRYIQKYHNGGGVVMATGTPITNSVSDIYVFQNYLQGGELDLLGLGNFDGWVGMFAEKTTEFEIGVTADAYRLATRFSKFHNVPELTTLLASVADFHDMGPDAGLPRFDGYTDVTIESNPYLKEYIKDLSKRADNVHEHKVNPSDDNMLKITSDSRKAALDIGLVMDGDDPVPVRACKVNACAERTARIYHETKDRSLTQLIFCDTSTPKKEFNVYDAVKERLLKLGVDPQDVAFVHDAETEARREKLFRQVREGEIRILLGSTVKLGTGVNVQDKLVAIHHLDIPWRPSDMVQREGRMLRAGNQNEKVEIYRYITKESFDAYSWQILETKQKFISNLLSGTTAGRSGSDVDGTALDYAEVKALAIGNPLVKSRVETSNELARLKILSIKDKEARLTLAARLKELPDIIDEKELELINLKEDVKFIEGKDCFFGYYADKNVRRGIDNYMRDLILYTTFPNNRDIQLQYSYKGFQVVIPKGTTTDNVEIELRRCGNYRLPLKDKNSEGQEEWEGPEVPAFPREAKGHEIFGDKNIRILLRIDNFLEKLGGKIDELQEELEDLKKEMIDTKNELEINCTDYSDRIDAVSRKLKELDKEIGITKE